MSKDFGQFQTKTEYIWRGQLILAPGVTPKWRVRGDMGGPGDRIMEVSIRAPRALWDLPSMTAEIRVGHSDAPSVHINAEAAAEALRPVLGADVRVTVHPSPDQTEDKSDE